MKCSFVQPYELLVAEQVGLVEEKNGRALMKGNNDFKIKIIVGASIVECIFLWS
jgi:hypothetical protein